MPSRDHLALACLAYRPRPSWLGPALSYCAYDTGYLYTLVILRFTHLGRQGPRYILITLTDLILKSFNFPNGTCTMDMIVNEADRAVAKLVGMTVNRIQEALRGGKNASVCIAAMIAADMHMGGNPLGRKKLFAAIARRLDDKGESKSSYATYKQIGEKLVVMYSAEIGIALKEAVEENSRASNKPITGQQLFDAVMTALERITNLLGSYTQLRAATKGDGADPLTPENKAKRLVVSLCNALNKLDDFAALELLGGIASRRAAMLNYRTPPNDVNAIASEAKALVDTLLHRYKIVSAKASDDVEDMEEEQEAAAA